MRPKLTQPSLFKDITLMVIIGFQKLHSRYFAVSVAEQTNNLLHERHKLYFNINDSWLEKIVLLLFEVS